jgi:hypothetical protein
VAGAASLEGQVGLSSGVAQVSLVVRSAPRVSVKAVGLPRETGRQGDLRAAVVGLRFSTNGAYRVVVRSADSDRASRVWVRAVDGTFKELGAGSAVIVARGTGSAGDWEREVSYRIEDGSGDRLLDLPVRYDIYVEPTL